MVLVWRHYGFENDTCAKVCCLTQTEENAKPYVTLTSYNWQTVQLEISTNKDMLILAHHGKIQINNVGATSDKRRQIAPW